MVSKKSLLIKTIILVALVLSVTSIPVSRNSWNVKCIKETIFPSKTPRDFKTENLEIDDLRETEELPSGGLFNLNDSAIAILSKLANLRFLNQAGRQQEVRNYPVTQEMAPQKYSAGDDELFRKNTSVEVPEKLEFEPKKFHCHPIEDIYIPAVDKMVPAYICKLEFRKFILSSERFLQDHKYHLDISLDETTFHRLVKPDDTRTRNSMANVIPVTLTQRQGDESYGLKKI